MLLSGNLSALNSGADMTSETMKILLMIFILGILETAIHLPKIWQSQHWMPLGRAVARFWSALALTDYVLQPAPLKRRTDRRRPAR
jgi:hypothetical protein